MKTIFSLFLTLTLYFVPFLTPLQAMEDQTMKKGPIVNIETSMGTIEVTLRSDIAPKASENFLTHAKNGYYNNMIFHRVIKGFMLQGGDPSGTGRGGASIWNAPFEDEFSEQAKFDRPGLLAMANSGPKTNGSQFFITTAATPWLNKKHTIFGEVTKGYDVVQKIESSKTGPGDRPTQEIKILRMTVNS